MSLETTITGNPDSQGEAKLALEGCQLTVADYQSNGGGLLFGYGADGESRLNIQNIRIFLMLPLQSKRVRFWDQA